MNFRALLPTDSVHKSTKPTLFSVFLLIACLTSWKANALVGGVDATSSQSRGIVGISYKDSFKNCIGVLLQADRVLTTAACLDDISSRITPEDIRVHPLLESEIGGNVIIPVLNENVTPFVGVSSFVFHPDNSSASGPYNLAVLSLDQELTIQTATLYGGKRSFISERAVAFGWEVLERSNGFFNERFYRAKSLLLPPLVDGDSDIDSIDNGCYDDFEDTDTVFCAGFKNDVQYLVSNDEGAPLLVQIDGESAVIGLLIDSSSGSDFEGEFRYEEYARTTPMMDFILVQAPNTKLVMESITPEQPSNSLSLPAIYLLLLDD